MDPVLDHQLEKVNVWLTLAFACEMLLKIVADGLGGYLNDSFNRFDGVVVVVSLLDLLATQLHIDIGINTNVLRAFRLLRIFKLVRSWKNLRTVLQAMLNAVGQLTNLFILLLLIIFIFALLGMSLFGGVYTPEVTTAMSAPRPPHRRRPPRPPQRTAHGTATAQRAPPPPPSPQLAPPLTRDAPRSLPPPSA
jgi:cytochrome b561